MYLVIENRFGSASSHHLGTQSRQLVSLERRAKYLTQAKGLRVLWMRGTRPDVVGALLVARLCSPLPKHRVGGEPGVKAIDDHENIAL